MLILCISVLQHGQESNTYYVFKAHYACLDWKTQQPLERYEFQILKKAEFTFIIVTNYIDPNNVALTLYIDIHLKNPHLYDCTVH